MRTGWKQNGTRAFVAVMAVCGALSPAALAAVGGMAAAQHEGHRPAGKAVLVRVAGGGDGTGGLPVAGVRRATAQ
jgi:hypothetical protein